MPQWQMADPFGTGLATALGAAASLSDARRQRQEDEYQRSRQEKLDTSEAAYKAALTRQASAQADADANSDAQPKGLTRRTTFKDAQDQAMYYLQLADAYNSVKNYKAAKQYTDMASALSRGDLSFANAAYVRDPKTVLTNAQTGATNAKTGLTKAQTATEQRRPALLQAQTRNVDDLPESRARKDADALRAREDAISAAEIKAANAQAAAWSRMMAGEDFRRGEDDRRWAHDDQRQQRGFAHSDHVRSENRAAAGEKPARFNAKILKDVQSQSSSMLNSGAPPHQVRLFLKTMYGLNDAQAQMLAPDARSQSQANGSNWFSGLMNAIGF